jgi:hypothetical protein
MQTLWLDFELKSLWLDFRAYTREVAVCKDLAPQLRATLDAAMLRAASSQQGGGVGNIEQALVQIAAITKDWEWWNAQGVAWADTLEDVVRMIERHGRAMHLRALTHLEQVHMALVVIRSLSVAGKAFAASSAFRSVCMWADGLRQSLVVLARASLAAVSASCGNYRSLAMPQHRVVEQDHALADLASLGCDNFLLRVRRSTFADLDTLVKEMEGQTDPVTATADRLRASPLAAALKESGKFWDRCCQELTSLLPASRGPAAPGSMRATSADELASGTEDEATGAGTALLRLLHWLRPLALGCPSPPLWLQPLSRAHSRPDIAAASATWVQRRWRARRVCANRDRPSLALPPRSQNHSQPSLPRAPTVSSLAS